MNLSKENLDKIGFSILGNFGYCWIAGGAISSVLRGGRVDDIDIFFPNEDSRKNAVRKLVSMGGEKIHTHSFEERVRFKGKFYDFMHLGRNPEETISRFDYTVCCVVIDKKGNFYCHEDYFDHIGSKKLHFIGNYPNVNFKNKTKRLKKYINKGYLIDHENLDYWLQRLIKEHNKLSNKKKIQITEFNIVKNKIDQNK